MTNGNATDKTMPIATPHIVVSDLRIHPIKGLCPVSVDSVSFLGHGRGIQYDREWALLNLKGYYVNGKSNSLVHKIRLLRFVAPSTVTLLGRCRRDNSNIAESDCNCSSKEEEEVTFDLIRQHKEAESWLCDALKNPGGRLVRSKFGSMVDDERYDGATIVSQATIDTVAGWYQSKDDGEFMNDNFLDRFRPNIVLSGDDVPAFWEDTLCDHRTTHGKTLHVTNYHHDDGDENTLQLIAVDSVHRCVVPTRVPSTTIATTTEHTPPGKSLPGFYKTFMEQRRKSFVNGAPVHRLTSGRAPLEAAFLCTFTAVLRPGSLRKGDQIVVSSDFLNVQSEIRKVRRMTSESMQALLDSAYSMRSLNLGTYRLASALNAILPTALSNAILAQNRFPDCWPKATFSEIGIGLLRVVLVVALAVALVSLISSSSIFYLGPPPACSGEL